MTSVAFAARVGAVPRASRRQAVTAKRPHHARPRSASATRSSHAGSWEVRSFAAASAAILMGFVLALAYLAASTGLSASGYDAQRLQGQRDELRRQNELLELDLARLGSPARIDAEAKRLGLVHVPFVPVVSADPLTALR